MSTQRIFGICSLIFGVLQIILKFAEGSSGVEFPASTWVFGIVFTFLGIVFTFGSPKQEAAPQEDCPSTPENQD